MKINVEMSIKFNAELGFDEIDEEGMQIFKDNQKEFVKKMKEEIKKDLDEVLIVEDDNSKSTYKITKFKVTVDEEEK